MQKIIIIEDERSLQKTLSDGLIQDGFEVFSALDGETGIALAKKEKPDLILLDLILPKMDGFEVLRQLKMGEETKSSMVIVLTNLESSGDVEKVLELGATTYLVKANYGLQEIIEKIKETLNKK
ncbi:MAG: response regulator [Candidatus Portnoybacteria bacterium CG10_big_fil_rev_8_21_14_0_10_36_7]|uniref:Response regulator n=1 Tax=Candidatus Portnoybacteria bacterium CG10_big_fil_rev_8_21_14_0_10_36_7 TaxID=1974812 RepID=A0A2M8KEZ6_9BACT|nr:MAG: response regulator [Candidatus Portnoybacteria bacterium CG10_big_fil_rev_8_21_14_0_10_36_7]